MITKQEKNPSLYLQYNQMMIQHPENVRMLNDLPKKLFEEVVQASYLPKDIPEDKLKIMYQLIEAMKQYSSLGLKFYKEGWIMECLKTWEALGDIYFFPPPIIEFKQVLLDPELSKIPLSEATFIIQAHINKLFSNNKYIAAQTIIKTIVGEYLKRQKTNHDNHKIMKELKEKEAFSKLQKKRREEERKQLTTLITKEDLIYLRESILTQQRYIHSNYALQQHIKYL